MRVIFCDSFFDQKIVDPDYEQEKRIVENNDFKYSLIGYEELTTGNVPIALKFVKESVEKENGIYRGWMLTPFPVF